MSTAEINLLTRQANAMAEKSGVVCRYEWSRVKARFQWSFYRHGFYLGSTSTSSKVLNKMSKYVTCKGSGNAQSTSATNQ